MHLLPDAVCRRALAAAEQHAEGALGEKEFIRVAAEFDTTRRRRFPQPNVQVAEDYAWNALYCAVHRRWRAYQDEEFAPERWRVAAVVAAEAAHALEAEDAREQAALLREVFGNPFRPATLNPAWQTPQVVPLAQAAYEERELPSGHLDVLRLAVLADALEDAGCDQADLLAHLRGPCPHVRGCWVIDLLLGKG
jgi:hypothetical protein